MILVSRIIIILFSVFFLSCGRFGDSPNISDTTIQDRRNISESRISNPDLQNAQSRINSSDKIINQPGSNLNLPDNSISRKITRNASLSIQVSDISKANEKFIEIVNKIPSAYISSSSSVMDEKYKYGNIIIRVPSLKFDELIKLLKNIGKVENESISAQDLTKEYFDLNARLKAEENYKTRLEEIMRTKAQTYENAQDAYSRILQVQERINRIKGQIEYINTITELSTIRISYFEGKYKQGKKIINAFTKIWDGIKDGVHNMILVLAYLIEYSLTLSIIFAFVILIMYLIKKYIKWHKSKNK